MSFSFFNGEIAGHKTLEKKHSEQKPHAKKRGLTEAQIAVHWKEEEYIRPPARFIAQANLNDPRTVERFSEKTFPSVSESTPSFSIGINTGTRLSTPNIPPSGSGLWAAA